MEYNPIILKARLCYIVVEFIEKYFNIFLMEKFG